MTTVHATNGHPQDTASGPRKPDRDAELVERLRRQDPNAAEELINQLKTTHQFPKTGDGTTLNLTILSAGTRNNNDRGGYDKDRPKRGAAGAGRVGSGWGSTSGDRSGRSSSRDSATRPNGRSV